MKQPLVNTNGDNWQTLYDNAVAAELALEKAFDAVHNLQPHGRNYQTNPPEDFAEANASWLAMSKNLRDSHREVKELRLSILKQRRK
jgi:hypothetical protein